MQAYLDRYKFEHHVVCGAVDEPSNVAFSMHQDKVLSDTCLLPSLKAYSKSTKLEAKLSAHPSAPNGFVQICHIVFSKVQIL